jgi:predicted HTH transcriptional regulator
MNNSYKRESQTVEFKKSFNEDVIETLVAFANTKGGRVLIGVADSGLPVKNFESSAYSY